MESADNEGYPPIITRKFVSGNSKCSSNFRVMQWNILADGLSQSSPSENFCAVPPKYLLWSFRSVQIEKQINSLDADIVCLEEVDHFHDFLYPKLSAKGYVGQFLEKKSSPCLRFPGNNGPDGVAMFFKTNKFELVETTNNYLQEEDGNFGQQGLLINVLRHIVSNKLIIVGVTHLKAKKDFFERRLAQTKHALQIFETVSKKYKDASVVWCGDFNGESTEPYHKAIIESVIKFSSSYAACTGNEPEFTTWKIRPKYEERHTIDYIWFTKSTLKVKDVLLAMSDEQVVNTRFPSFDHASDHIALCCDYDFL